MPKMVSAMSKKRPNIVPINQDIASKIANELHSIAERNPNIADELTVVMNDYSYLISKVDKAIVSCNAILSSAEERLSKINAKIDKKSSEEAVFSYEFLDALETVLKDAGIPLSAVYAQQQKMH